MAKLLALPKYLLALVLSWFVPRVDDHWVFGSGIGWGEGALALAHQLQREDPAATISWIASDEAECEKALAAGFQSELRNSWAGFWATLRAQYIVVTHGLGDVNRFGIYGGFVVQLWHGAPLKRIHLDSPVTTSVRGPMFLRRLLRRMYRAGSRQVDLFVAGSVTAATRLRSAFQVDPGRVRVLGDPRHDELTRTILGENPSGAREQLCEALGLDPVQTTEKFVLYAPTWRDGAADPAVPTEAELAHIDEMLRRQGAKLVVRPHPLGVGAYDGLSGAEIHVLHSTKLRDITPALAAFDVVITDYSSIAIDFALTGKPILWFAPDLDDYLTSRGLYEPLEVTTAGRVLSTWDDTVARLDEVLGSQARSYRDSVVLTQALAQRFHAYTDGASASRVLAEVRRLQLPADQLIPQNAVFFESFYGKQITCNPFAIDREIANRYPHVVRLWSVTNETQTVPDGATALLVGGRDWHIARQQARLLVVNDWLRFGFRRRSHQTVLQTWHGTMLKHLALGRPHVGLRTRLAIRRESRRWNLLLSQNPHSSEQFRTSYAYRGEILESGYPRDDRLARAMVGDERNPIEMSTARLALGIARDAHVLVYAPTWRDGGVALVDELGVDYVARELGDDWTIVVRGHTRTQRFGSYVSGSVNVIDASRHSDVNDVILAADVLVTDYSSIMFDASVAQVPQLFFVPDIDVYRDRERGFTFDFESAAPGPLISDRDDVISVARRLVNPEIADREARSIAGALPAWRERFNPHDDGNAAARVVDALVARGAFSDAAS